MKLKHSNCQNCGANDYKPLSRYEIECTYCGSKYATGEKESDNADETRYYNELGELMRIEGVSLIGFTPRKYQGDYLKPDELLAMANQRKGFLSEVADGISQVGSMFNCFKTLFGK